jgi:plasmid stabilization system protein ParE
VSVRWTQPALGDIAGVFAYIARDNEEAAIRVVDELMAAGAGLEFHPRMGRPGRVRGTRGAGGGQVRPGVPGEGRARDRPCHSRRAEKALIGVAGKLQAEGIETHG